MTEPTPKPPLTDEQKAERKALSKAITEAASRIADDLGEAEAQPRATIWRSVKALGIEQAQALLARTHEIDAAGGMMTADNTRRRTPGGVYFALVREMTNGKDRFFIFGTQKPAHAKPASAPQKTVTPAAPVTPFVWADRITALQTIRADRGEARTVKITLVGHLGKTIDQGAFYQATMTADRAPALPKGLPAPPAVEATYIVFIQAKQFRKIAEAANDAEDVVIIEGWCQPDAETGAIAVWATNVTSKKLQAATREQKAQD
jgi:hypothetical protein